MLTVSEKLIMSRLSLDPATGTTTCTLMEVTKLSRGTVNACLRKLRDERLADFVPARARRWFRTKKPFSPTVTITAGRSIDDTLGDLQTMASTCGTYQQALHDIANILAEAGIRIPVLDKGEKKC